MHFESLKVSLGNVVENEDVILITNGCIDYVTV